MVMEEKQAANSNKDRGILWLTGVLFVVALVIIMVFNFGKWSGKQEGFAIARQSLTDKPGSGKSNPVITPSPADDGSKAVTGEPDRVFENPERKYKISLWGPLGGEERGKCLMKLSDQSGRETDMTALLGQEEINCSDIMGNFTSDFVTWGPDGKFVLKRGREYAIVGVKPMILEIYPTAGVGDNLSRVDKTLNFWLFGPKIADDQMKYELRNRSGSLLKTVTYPEQDDGYHTVMYDRVNNGMLFVTEGLDSEATQKARENNEPVDNGLFWTKFDWMNLGTLGIRTLLVTDPVYLGGRGCYPETLESVPGTVIIKMNTAPCILIDNKYLENGTLRLEL